MTNRFKTFFSCVVLLALVTGARSISALDSPALSLARQLNEAFIEVADKVSPSVVVIEVVEKPKNDHAETFWGNFLHHGQPHPTMGEGSGVVITPDGYILTNNHVVEDADSIEVRFKDGRSFPAEVKGTDPESDIAVIKIKATNLPAATLGDSDSTRVGEFVVAIGAPFALSYTVTFGHVSAKGRSFEGDTAGYADQDFIQTDASINPGNSGGPLVNLYGEVVGINTMIQGINTGIGFAVPINLAKRVKDHLIAEGKFTRSWIGVHIAELSEARDEQRFDLSPDVNSGIVIAAIVPDGPASKSGLREGDVVTLVGGKPVSTARQLKEAISREKPDTVLAFSVVRARDHLTINVKTEALPPPDLGLDRDRTQPARDLEVDAPDLGLTVEALTEDVASAYGMQPNSGVVVEDVDGDSPASKVGLQAGDVIRKVNRTRVNTLKQFVRAMKMADQKKGVLLEILTENSSKLVLLKQDEPAP